ncbi:MAG: tetratricopeptide repeat protein [Pirellulales bacterium]|jgi:tetratricopeptide (TPR) repeat protein
MTSKRRSSRSPVAPRQPTPPGAVSGGKQPLHRRTVSLTVALVAILATTVVAALPWLLAPAVPGPPVPPADPMVARAIDAAQGRVRVEPRSAAAWGELGLLLEAHGHVPEAGRCFRRAASLDPTGWRWPCCAAASLGETAPAEAAALVVEAIARDPAAPWPRLLRGEWLASLGRLEEARTEFEELLARHPDHARGRLALSRVHVALGDFAATAALLEPLAADPRTRRAAGELAALVAARRGDAAVARDLAAAAARLPADLPWPPDPLAAELPARRVGRESRIRQVALLEAAGDTRAADLLTQRVEQEHPEVFHFIEGRMQLAGGDPVAAEGAFRRALELDRESVDVRVQLALALFKQNRQADAAAVLREGLSLEPGHGPSWLELGRCLRATDPAAARAALEMAVATMPASAEARTELERFEGDGR